MADCSVVDADGSEDDADIDVVGTEVAEVHVQMNLHLRIVLDIFFILGIILMVSKEQMNQIHCRLFLDERL